MLLMTIVMNGSLILLFLFSIAWCDTGSNAPICSKDTTDTLHLQQLVSQESLLRMTLDKQVQELRALVYRLDVDLRGKIEDALSQQSTLKQELGDLELELRKTNASVPRNITDILREIEFNTERKLDKMDNFLSIDDIEERLRNRSSALESKIADFQAVTAQRIEEFKERKDERIVFSVTGLDRSLKTDLLRYASLNRTILFETILTNEGNGYNISTGVFTAPRISHYVFMWSVSSLRSRCTIDLIKNGTSLGIPSSTDGILGTSGSTSVIKLVKGDRVWIKGSSRCSRFVRYSSARFFGFEI